MTKFVFEKICATSSKGYKFPIYQLSIQKEGKKPVKFNLEFKKMFEFEKFLNSVICSGDDLEIEVEDNYQANDEND